MYLLNLCMHVCMHACHAEGKDALLTGQSSHEMEIERAGKHVEISVARACECMCVLRWIRELPRGSITSSEQSKERLHDEFTARDNRASVNVRIN